MEPVSSEEILAAFGDYDQEISLPDLARVDWASLEYLGWIHPGGHVGYVLLLSPEDARLKGVVLRRDQFSGGKPGFEMCSLCHHVHRSNGTAMFTITKKNTERRHSIGNIVCKDLDCSLQIRNLKQPVSFVKETLYLEAKIWRMQLALHKWLKSAERL